MASKIDELQLIISANADQMKNELISVKQELKRLNDTTKDVSNGFGSAGLFGNILKANLATNIITGVVTKATTAFKGFVGQVIEGGSALSRLRIANSVVTKNLGLTSEQVNGLRDSLADANTYGIAAENIISSLALSGLVKMAEGLEYVDARTGETVKGVTGLTLAIKDLAAARGIDSDLGIERITKFIQRGETTFADGLIEIGEINREYAEYGRQIGKTTDMLSAEEKAWVRLNVVKREGAKSFGAYAATYNTSGKIFRSVQRLVRGIATEIGANLEPVMRVGALGILEFFSGIQEAVFGSADAIRNGANRIAGYMVALVRLIGRLLQNLPLVGAGFKKWADFTLKPIQSQGKLSDAVSGTGAAFDDAADKAGKLKKEMDDLAGFDEMNVLTQPTDTAAAGATTGGTGFGADFGGGLAGVQDTTEEIMKYAKQAEESINSVIKPIGDFINGLKEIKIFGIPVTDILLEVAKYAGLAFLAFKALSPIVGLVSGLFGGFGGILGTVGAILGSISLPIPAVVAGIGLLVAGVISAWQNSEEFRNSITETFNQVGVVIGEIVALFQEKLPAFQAAIQPLIDSIGEVISRLWLNTLKPLVDFVLANIVPALRILIDVIIFVIGVFSQVASTIIDLVVPILRTLWDVFTQVFEGVRSVVEFVWDNVLKPILTAIWDFISKFVIPMLQLFFKIAEQVFNGIRQAVEYAWSRIYEAIKPVIDWFNNNIMPVINKVKDGIEQAFNGVKNSVENIWNGIGQIVKNAINWLIDRINDFIRGINGMLQKIDDSAGTLGINVDFRVGEIPRLATGGIIQSPTLAMMGEGGYKEAVIPLEQNTEWMDTLAGKLAERGGSGGQNLVVKLGEDTIFEKFIDYVNDRTLATNRTVLNI